MRFFLKMFGFIKFNDNVKFLKAVSQSPAPPMVRGMVGTFRMPVPILQQVIGLFSYKEVSTWGFFNF